MKTRILFVLCCLILMSNGGKPQMPWEKENVSFPMMNQEIRNAYRENERQVELKNKQTTNMAAETVNKKEWTKFKETSAKIQDRLRFIDFTLQAIPTGHAITLEIEKIYNIQRIIFNEIESAPYAALVAIPNQIKFADDLQMNLRLLTGIVLSYGAINQMERAERKILTDYALDEIRKLTYSADYTLMNVRSFKAKINWNKARIKHFVSEDKRLIKEIMSKVKTF